MSIAKLESKEAGLDFCENYYLIFDIIEGLYGRNLRFLQAPG